MKRFSVAGEETQLVEVAKLHSLVIPVSDLPAAGDWYARFLPVVQIEQGCGFTVLTLAAGCNICLLEVRDYKAAEGLSPYPVLAVPHAAAMRETLASAGVPVSAPEAGGQHFSFAFWDPDGNRIEAAQFGLARER
jgi:catechol 2,3-dioxygenase-like lactoylglutathione lyase family enzyme